MVADLDLEGAMTLATFDDLRAVKLRDGRIGLVFGNDSCVLEPTDQLEIESGGMSAAVGIVPITGYVVRGGRKLTVYDTAIDEAMTDINSYDVRKELEAVLVAAATAAGARYIR